MSNLDYLMKLPDGNKNELLGGLVKDLKIYMTPASMDSPTAGNERAT